MPGLGRFCEPFAMFALLLIVGSGVLWYKVVRHVSSHKNCPSCLCDCPSLLPDLGFGNRSADWTKINIQTLCEERNKSFIDLLLEELRLEWEIVDDAQQKFLSVLRDAKKVVSQYHKEAEKCNIGLETCEESREKAQGALLPEKKVSEIWKARAEFMGWNVSTKKE